MSRESAPSGTIEEQILGIFDDASHALYEIENLEKGLASSETKTANILHDHIAKNDIKKYDLDDTRKNPTIKEAFTRYFTLVRQTMTESQWFLVEIEQRERELAELAGGQEVRIKPADDVNPRDVFSLIGSEDANRAPEVLKGRVEQTSATLGQLVVRDHSNPDDCYMVNVTGVPGSDDEISKVQVSLTIIA